jgi:cytolysin (calcineurin-like family phosphatase)
MSRDADENLATPGRSDSPRRDVGRLMLIAVAALLLHVDGCNWAGDDACSSPILAAVQRQPLDGTDITFFVTADTHFGFAGGEKLNARQIDAMNSLPGKPLPSNLGGTVQKPLGVLIAGDLTENGHGDQWRAFVKHYGLDGTDGKLTVPVYEGTGNHDRDLVFYRPALDGVTKRHGSLTYSWDWDDVHVVCLDLYPSAANLRWLQRDLTKVGRRVPVVLYFHYSIVGPFSEWWSAEEKDAFARVIKGTNVVGIFHGHFHASMHYRWRGYDVYNVGAVRHGWHSFATVHITDTEMTVASWDWGHNRWRWTHRKAIQTAAPVTDE